MPQTRWEIDLAIRVALQTQHRVRIPAMPMRKQAFWRYFIGTLDIDAPAVTFTSGKSALPPYRFNMGPCIAFSGGLESMYLAASMPQVHRIGFNQLPHLSGVIDFEFHDFRMPGIWHEGDIAVYTAGMGFGTVFIGTEYLPAVHVEPDHCTAEELRLRYEEQWYKYSGQAMVSPLRGMCKDEVALALRRLSPDLYANVISCDVAGGRKIPTHCGRCYKCHLLEHISRAIDYPLGIKLVGKCPDTPLIQFYRKRLEYEYEYRF